MRLSVALGMLVIPAVLLVSCSFSRDSSRDSTDAIPSDYITSEDGVYSIDLAEASEGQPRFDPSSYSLVYDGNMGETTFKYSAVSGMAGVSLSRTLEQLPIEIAPTLTPGNGIAELFVAVEDRQPSDSSSLTLLVVMDEDWREVIANEIFISTAEFGPNFEPYAPGSRGMVVTPRPLDAGYPKLDLRQVDFNQMDSGLAVERLNFSGLDNPEDWKGSPVVTISNLQQSYDELQGRVANLEMEQQDLIVFFSVPFTTPGAISSSQTLSQSPRPLR